jgi:hypothetical protein
LGGAKLTCVTASKTAAGASRTLVPAVLFVPMTAHSSSRISRCRFTVWSKNVKQYQIVVVGYFRFEILNCPCYCFLHEESVETVF